LKVTMLQPDVPGIPYPTTYRIVSMDTFKRVEGISRVRNDWARLVGREQAGS